MLGSYIRLRTAIVLRLEDQACRRGGIAVHPSRSVDGAILRCIGDEAVANVSPRVTEVDTRATAGALVGVGFSTHLGRRCILVRLHLLEVLLFGKVRGCEVATVGIDGANIPLGMALCHVREGLTGEDAILMPQESTLEVHKRLSRLGARFGRKRCGRSVEVARTASKPSALSQSKHIGVDGILLHDSARRLHIAVVPYGEYRPHHVRIARRDAEDLAAIEHLDIGEEVVVIEVMVATIDGGRAVHDTSL